jgi:thiazole/oxazole-forming peptide maturase SagD family component
VTALRFTPTWMAGICSDGFVVLGPDTQLQIDLFVTFDQRMALLAALRDGPDEQVVADAMDGDAGDARALLDMLREHGALTAGTGIGDIELPGVPLRDAILAASARDPIPGVVWTAEEVLVLPEDLDPARARWAIRAFVAGIEPHPRRVAYGYVANWGEPTTIGDIPEREALDAGLRRVAELDPTAIHVADLDFETVHSVAPEDLRRLDGSRAHRLGPVAHLDTTELLADGDEPLYYCTARAATPNLRHPGTGDSHWARGSAPDRELAELVARAEAVERYAAGDVARAPLVRAAADELFDAVPPAAFYARSAAQRARDDPFAPFDPGERYLWTPATTPSGARRWVLAECVHFPFTDPERDDRLTWTTSSGVAAYTDPAEARRRAALELIERDAFMWTWVQGISRERIATDSLPERVRRRIAQAQAKGLDVALVNLTLDLAPVVLCAVYDEHWLQLGAASDPDPGIAAWKALDEAIGILSVSRSGGPLDVPAEEVATPVDHLRFNQTPERRAEIAFLYSSPETVDVRELPRLDRPIDETLQTVGTPLTIDLTVPAARPFWIVRVLVPGLVPITFGYDREPLGMPRVAEPKMTLDGRRLGSRLDLADAPVMLPHPFP